MIRPHISAVLSELFRRPEIAAVVVRGRDGVQYTCSDAEHAMAIIERAAVRDGDLFGAPDRR